MKKTAVTGLCLLPGHLDKLTPEREQRLHHFGESVLPDPTSFTQEIRRWKTFWSGRDNTTSICDTIHSMEKLLFPNIYFLLNYLLIVPVSAATVERANSAFKFIKTDRRSVMSSARMNALLCLFVHKDIKLDIDIIVNKFANKSNRKLMLV